ncbi:MAG: hypothetical protein OXF02_02825 [Simkaniaceae bacterium]|nr:hypothetical protein [Simkaniaceae bacterium]
MLTAVKPLYDIRKTYRENLETGPFFEGEVPPASKIGKPIDLFGYTVRSPVGVPAGPLLGSKWIALAGALGFDITTYKTIRSRPRSAHPLPNMVHVRGEEEPYPSGVTGGASLPVFTSRGDSPPERALVSVTNSFGNPSMSGEFLMQDIADANGALAEDQLMIVSVFGEAGAGRDPTDDFVEAALLAKEAGAKVIEANFSCPNLPGGTRSVPSLSPYEDERGVFDAVRKIASAIRPLPLVVKVGLFETEERMRNVMVAMARGGARGLCGINTVRARIVTPDGAAALGEGRETGGVCGHVIRASALAFVRRACAINAAEKLGLTVMGVGGIMLPDHFDRFFEAGAEVAMTATGMMWEPYLAVNVKERVGGGGV